MSVSLSDSGLNASFFYFPTEAPDAVVKMSRFNEPIKLDF